MPPCPLPTARPSHPPYISLKTTAKTFTEISVVILQPPNSNLNSYV